MAQIILIADEGKVYTNGSAYGLEVYLGTGDSVENWYQVDIEELEKESELTDVLP